MVPVTSQGASAVTSSQAVVVMAASPTSSAVTPSLSSLLSTSSEAPIVGRLHQVNSVVVSSHFKPLMRSSVSEHAPQESSILSSSVEPTPADVSQTVSDTTDASAAVTAPPTIKGKKLICVRSTTITKKSNVKMYFSITIMPQHLGSDFALPSLHNLNNPFCAPLWPQNTR